MSQEQEQPLPIRRSGFSTAAGATGGAAAGGALGVAGGFFAGAFGAPLAAGIAAAAITGGAVLVIGLPLALIFGGSLVGVGSAALAGASIFGGLGALAGILGMPLGASLGAWIGGIVGGVKGAGYSLDKSREQTVAANQLDAQLNAAAMDAQARMMQAQATMVAAQAKPRHHVTPQCHRAASTIQCSKDNQLLGRVAYAPEPAMAPV